MERLLGVVMGPGVPESAAFLSAEEKMIRKRLTAWMRFLLTIFGRVLLANASAMSMLWHTAAVTFVEQKVLNSVWKRVNHFVDGKSCFRSKIAFDLRRGSLIRVCRCQPFMRCGWSAACCGGRCSLEASLLGQDFGGGASEEGERTADAVGLEVQQPGEQYPFRGAVSSRVGGGGIFHFSEGTTTQ